MPTKDHLVKAMVFPVVIYGCERWTIKKAERRRIDTFELWYWRRLLRVPWTARDLDCKPVNPKGNQSWIFIGRTDAEAPVLGPSDAKNWLIGKDLDAGKDWRQEKGTTENKLVGWHHQCDGHEFEQTLGVGDGQGGLACCSPWGLKESDMTDQLNWLTGNMWKLYSYTSSSLPLHIVIATDYILIQQPPTFLAPGTFFMEDSFSTEQGWRGWFQDDSSALHLLYTLFLIQCHLWSNRRYWSAARRLGTPVLIHCVPNNIDLLFYSFAF